MTHHTDIKIALAQCNFTVGDIAGNVARMAALHTKATRENTDLIIFSEMAITGYPPEDLVLRPAFQNEAMQAIQALAEHTRNACAMLAGGIWREGNALYNTVFLLHDGIIAHKQHKHKLPNYGVFDEKRVFAPGALPEPVRWQGIKTGILICEDMWDADTASHLKAQRADLLIALNASPYEMKKQAKRLDAARQRVGETGLPLLYVNQVGGQDELVFDGYSFVMTADGEVIQQLAGFEEDYQVITMRQKGAGGSPELSGDGNALKLPHGDETAAVYQAMKMGLHDYVFKNRFKGVLLGLSGGIDSALTAAVAVDALGAERVHAVMMPSAYTSSESLEDAAECARLLGIRLDTIAIMPAMSAFDAMLAPVFAGKSPDVTEENIQSRIRGSLLMAISNKEGLMVLTTGNKSEMAVGYATLYGDMCGGYNILKDIYKTYVYCLADWRNQKGRVIPENIITKAPSAELRPEQKDQDSLPPYDILDGILEKLIEHQLSVEEIITQGFEAGTVLKVAKLLYRAEYKRRQSAPGVKITPMAFGRDRRYPMTVGHTIYSR